jgi:hypothetical protein
MNSVLGSFLDARVVVRLWIGLVFDTELVRRDPTITEGLSELSLAAAVTAAGPTVSV